MNINIRIIPHKHQRYDTCGDWWFAVNENNNNPITLEIRVSRLNDFYEEFCIAIHEQIEAMLCLKRGITEKEVTEFDIKFESELRTSIEEEPGNHPQAPYKNEHIFATHVEELLAAELKIDWKSYEDKINNL